MGETLNKEDILQELKKIQDYLRDNGENRKANMLDFAEGFVKKAPVFLCIDNITNPDTNRNLEFVNKRECVAVLVTDSKMKNVLLVRQFRAGHKNYIHEVVAGVVDPGQEPLDAVFAELRQEVGVDKNDILSISYLGDYYSSVGWTNEIAHLYVVKLKDGFEQHEQQLDEEECLSYIWIDEKSLSNVFKNKPIPIKTGMLIQNFYHMKEGKIHEGYLR